MAKKQEQRTSPSNVIELGGRELYLTMPKGRKGRAGIIKAQKAFEALISQVGGSSNLTAVDNLEALAASRMLFEYEGFEDEIMPWVLQNTTDRWSEAEALDFYDDVSDSTINIMNQFIAAMLYFLAGTDKEALTEAMGKSSAADQET